jgi:hypothetical protein
MLSPDKLVLLKSFLGSLPKDVAARLATAIELDRLADGTALPHDVILEGLRPALRSDEMHRRTPTPLRLFCRPFEDLLFNIPRREKQKGRILRAHVVPIWHWVSQTLLRSEAQSYSADIRTAALTGRYAKALERAERFWPLAGKAMSEALTKNRKSAATALGGDAIADDAADVGLVLQAGNAMLDIQSLLPKPTPVLSEELLWGLRRIFDEVMAAHSDVAPFVAVVAMRRLARPWEALKLATLVARQTHDAMISSTDMGLAGDVLFSDMEDCRDAIMAIRQPHFDSAALLHHLATFTEMSSAIVKEVEILRTGRWGQRLLKDRAAVGGVMDSFMEKAPKEIAGGLPTHKAGYSGGPRVPDLNRPVDPDRIERAQRYAAVLDGTRLLAVPGSFGAKHQTAVDEASQYVRSYSEDLLKELRAAEGPKRDIAERQFVLALELTRRLFDESEYEFLRRRGKAAGAQNLFD